MKAPALLAFALAFTCALSGCEKDNADPDGLVAATQEGKNTGDFLINGQPYRPRPRPSCNSCNPVSAHFYTYPSGQNNDIRLSFYKYISNDDAIFFNIYLADIWAPGQFVLRAQVSPNIIPGRLTQYANYEVDNLAGVRSYLTGPTAQGTVTVTRFDLTARIIAGTFEAKVKEYNGTDSLSITKGRFDLKF